MIWPADPNHPKTEQNTVPLYVVTWDGKKKRTGNRWSNRVLAEEVYRRKEDEGKNPDAAVMWVAGR